MVDTVNGRVDAPRSDQRTVAELVRDATQQLGTLVRDELRLAVAEIQRKGRRLGVGAGLFGIAGVLALYGGGAVVAGLVLLLATAVAPWLAAFIVGAAVLLVAAVMALIGKRQAERGIPPMPDEAVASIRKDIDTVRGGTHR